jgi:hypothetical protein
VKLKRIFLTISFILLSTLTVYAYTDISESYDTSLIQGIEYTYKEPRKLLFVQIEGQYDQLSLSTKEFLDFVYYYSITKLKLGHPPFHYALDESGNVYKTGMYDLVQITDEPYIVIGYLSNSGQLNNSASEAVLSITDEISQRYGIKEFEVYSYQIAQTEDSFSRLKLVEPNAVFKNSIESVLSDWKGYDRENLQYTAEIVNVEYSETVEVGTYLDVTVTVKNKNDFIWTSDKYPIYVSTENSEETVFAINEVWDSFSRATHLDSDTYVLPGQETTFNFQIDPKVLPGEYSQTFYLLKFDGEPFANSIFTVNFTVKKGDQRLVRIDSPEAGYVNIRNCRRFSCEQIDVVNHDEVYPIVEYHESCWYKIRYAEGKEGWFYCPYGEEVE